MESEMIAAMSIAGTALIASVGGQVIAIITAWKANTKIDKVAEVTGKVVEVSQTIETNTNHRADRQDNLILALTDQVKSLTAHVAEQRQAAAVKDEKMATAVAEATVAAITSTLPPVTAEMPRIIKGF